VSALPTGNHGGSRRHTESFLLLRISLHGILIPVGFQDLLLSQLLRVLVSGLLIPWLTVKINLDALTVGGYIFVLGPLSFASYLQLNMMPAKMNIQEQFHAFVLKYKQVSLLVINFNSLFCGRMFIRVILPGLGIPIVCFSSIFLMKNVLSFDMVAFLSMVGLAVCLTVHLLLTFCADVWSNSNRFLHEISKVNSKQARYFSFRKRLLMSMFPIRIKLGESNFVEMSTPLVVMSLCIQQTVNILCLKNRSI